jgi:hypothetical protein
MNESTSSFLRYKGARGPGGEKGELAGTNQQRAETQNDVFKMHQIHTIDEIPAESVDVIPCC